MKEITEEKKKHVDEDKEQTRNYTLIHQHLISPDAEAKIMLI